MWFQSEMVFACRINCHSDDECKQNKIPHKLSQKWSAILWQRMIRNTQVTVSLPLIVQRQNSTKNSNLHLPTLHMKATILTRTLVNDPENCNRSDINRICKCVKQLANYAFQLVIGNQSISNRLLSTRIPGNCIQDTTCSWGLISILGLTINKSKASCCCCSHNRLDVRGIHIVMTSSLKHIIILLVEP